SDSVIKNLIFKGLIEDVGRSEGPGRPILYGTTSSFLQHFGISSLKELPPINAEDDQLQIDLKSDKNVENSESDPQYVSMKLPENDG
ncbi:MAG TPA: segregation/condensation protein B, partial [Chloroflexi bacterium]|nr:segregation/condensation protein B [Chloroflexota bacterium]